MADPGAIIFYGIIWDPESADYPAKAQRKACEKLGIDHEGLENWELAAELVRHPDCSAYDLPDASDAEVLLKTILGFKQVEGEKYNVYSERWSALLVDRLGFRISFSFVGTNEVADCSAEIAYPQPVEGQPRAHTSVEWTGSLDPKEVIQDAEAAEGLLISWAMGLNTLASLLPGGSRVGWHVAARNT
jgi:hypothetical protein